MRWSVGLRRDAAHRQPSCVLACGCATHKVSPHLASASAWPALSSFDIGHWSLDILQRPTTLPGR